jgi:thioredoxin 2
MAEVAVGKPRIIACPSCGTRNRIKTSGTGAPHCAKCGNLLPWLVDADDSSFDEVVKGSLPVVVDFWAPWCGPCRIVSPAVERLASSPPGRVKVVKVNTDDSPRVSQRFGIQGIPTLVVMKDGKEADRVTGAMPEPQIRQWLEPRLQN